MTYTVNDDNQYTIIRDISLTYDTDGNMLSDGNWTYTWDGENRLTRMVSTNLTKTLSFTYDYQGRRIEKKVWNNTTGTGTPATYLKYLYDGWNLIAELNGNSSNAKVRSYTWGLDVSGSTTEAGGVGALLMVDDASNGVHFVSYDLNGNVMGLVKATNGTVSAAYEYGPFGELLVSTGTMASSNPFRFSTKYRDNETDLYYYGYRYYSPSLGRWISRDPIDERGGLNLYSFVNNDPINSVDWLGLWDEYIHYKMTQKWAKSIGFKEEFAKQIAMADEAIDNGSKGPWPVNGDQSYHFNRPWSETTDSRLNHHNRLMKLAKDYCTFPNDFPRTASLKLGQSLHPLQDWVAHGDYGFDSFFDKIWIPHGGLGGAWLSKIRPVINPIVDFALSNYEKVDNPLYDNDGDTKLGRPIKVNTTRFLIVAAPYGIHFSDPISYSVDIILGYSTGNKRFNTTKQMTLDALKDFRDHVKYFGGPCCKSIFYQYGDK